jgi:DNA-directed RNA polymerase subunit RPC12/RpoP
MDCREEELYSMFMFEDGFIPEGVWGDADQNFIASSYKCFRCGTRLYKAEFPEGREPVLLFGPRKDKGIIPARVFTCPKCGRFFAVPKKRKLIQGPVFMAAPILNKDNRSGRAIYDSWWEYFNYLGEI